jgi:hypothetical protein
MAHKIIVKIEPTTENEVFIARSWQEIPELDVNILNNSIENADLKQIPRLDQLQAKQDQYYHREIAKRIGRSAVVVAVLLPDKKSDGISRNVIYELGLADSLGKPTVIIANNSSLVYESVSDLAGRNLFLVNSHTSDDGFREALTNAIKLAKERGEPEYLVDRETYQNLTVVSEDEVLTNVAVTTLKALFIFNKIKSTFSNFQEGAVKTVNQHISNLKILSLQTQRESIVQTLDNFIVEFSRFEDQGNLVADEIIKYKTKLKELSMLIKTEEKKINDISLRITSYSQSYDGFINKAKSLLDENKVSQPDLKDGFINELDPYLSKLKLTIGRITSGCDVFQQSSIDSIKF